jgi:hypothetical protein
VRRSARWQKRVTCHFVESFVPLCRYTKQLEILPSDVLCMRPRERCGGERPASARRDRVVRPVQKFMEGFVSSRIFVHILCSYLRFRGTPYSQTHYLQAPSLRHRPCSKPRLTVELSFITIPVGCLTVLIMLKKSASHSRVLFEGKILRKNFLASWPSTAFLFSFATSDRMTVS